MIGFLCIQGSLNVEDQCVRMASERVYYDYDTCFQQIQIYKGEFSDLNKDTKTAVEFTCVPSYLIEDILTGIRT
jgi:hypothetical protein|tara:strand:+ start:43 stop:264 length:222 start_codon:yes stop_codon:yes gene_type:complete